MIGSVWIVVLLNRLINNRGNLIVCNSNKAAFSNQINWINCRRQTSNYRKILDSIFTLIDDMVLSFVHQGIKILCMHIYKR